MGNPPPLRVETPSLTWDPAVVTVPPLPVIPPGGDPMSVMISAIMPELAAPLTADVAATRAREEQFAANLAGAQAAYQSTDQAGEQEIRTVANPLATANPATSGSVGGQSGQFMSTAMQTTSQAAQAPMQLMGMAAAAPQGIMQGAQGAIQQVGQLSGQIGKPEGESDLPAHQSLGEEQSAQPDDDGAGTVEQAPVGEEPPAAEGPPVGEGAPEETPGQHRRGDDQTEALTSSRD